MAAKVFYVPTDDDLEVQYDYFAILVVYSALQSAPSAFSRPMSTRKFCLLNKKAPKYCITNSK